MRARMNRIIFGVLLSFNIASCATNKAIDVVGGFSGIWQFPERLVWVEILPDGQVYQCRIDIEGSPISSKGELHDNSTIQWQQVWQPDEIRREGDTIYLKGPYGDFGFEKTNTKMMDKCLNPFSLQAKAVSPFGLDALKRVAALGVMALGEYGYFNIFNASLRSLWMVLSLSQALYST